MGQYLKETLTLFTGRGTDAESTVMPSARSWVKELIQDHSTSSDDAAIFVWLNCPAIGVMSASRLSFILNFISNILADHPINAVAVLVNPNRAGGHEGRQGISS